VSRSTEGRSCNATVAVKRWHHLEYDYIVRSLWRIKQNAFKLGTEWLTLSTEGSKNCGLRFTAAWLLHPRPEEWLQLWPRLDSRCDPKLFTRDGRRAKHPLSLGGSLHNIAISRSTHQCRGQLHSSHQRLNLVILIGRRSLVPCASDLSYPVELGVIAHRKLNYW